MTNIAAKTKRVAVVGAGVAGLASALYLTRLGFSVTVFERFPEARPVGSGLMLQPTGMSVLDDLGLLDSVLRFGQPISGLLGRDAQSGRIVLDVPYRGGRFGLGIHRAALFQVLFDAVIAEGIPIDTAREIVGADQSGTGVTLVCAGTPSIDQTFDLLIDAAGTHSPLRDPGDHDAVQKPFAYGAFWATLALPETGFSFDLLEQRYRRASVMIGVMPAGRLPGARTPTCAFFWSVKRSDVNRVKSEGLEAWKEGVQDLWPATAPLLEQVQSFSDLAVADYQHLTLRRPYHGRIIHVGDSAHSTSPQLGQGANMALLDACALLHAARHADSLADVGPFYARSRRFHVRFFQLASRALTPFYQSDGRLIPWFRDGMVATIAKVPPMPHLLSHLVSGTLVSPFKSIGLQEVDLKAKLNTHNLDRELVSRDPVTSP